MLKPNGRIASGIAALALTLPVVSLLLPSATPIAGAADIAGVTCDPVVATQPATEPTLLSFDPQLAERIVDTRIGTGGVTTPVGAGCTLRIDMSGVGGDDIAAFALSVTVISPELGFFTAFPCAEGQPGTSSVNARAGVPTPNLVVGVPDATGMLCLFSQRGGNVVIDVSGWWTEGPNRFTPIEPTRAYDTRALDQPLKLPADAIQAVDIAGEFVPEDAVSVSLSIAAVAPETNGFLVVYPCGQPVPLASNLNFVAGERRAVTAIVELGSLDAAAEGKLCVSGNATTHFLVDITGYDAPSAFTSPDVTIEPVADTRVVDTRDGSAPGVRFGARTTQRFDLSSVIERPDDAVAVVLNAVAVRAESASFLSITPCVAGTPTTSSLNYDLNQTANLVVTSLTVDTEFCVYTDTAVDVVIDLVGVVTGPEGSLINQLSLAEIDGTLVPLDQEFAVDSPDATMRCPATRNLRLRLGTASGVTATVNVDGLPVGAGTPVEPDRPTTLRPDDLLSIQLTRGTETAEYYVRCLPADFPTLLVEKADGAAPGWYLTDFGALGQSSQPFLAILDERGVPVWYQRLDQGLFDAKLLSTGDLVASPLVGGPFGIDGNVGHRIIGLDGTLVDEHLTDSVDQPDDHHDYIEIPSLPKGRAMITYPLVTGIPLMDLDLSNTIDVPLGNGMRGNFPNSCPDSVVGPDQDVVDSTIRELRADGADADTRPDLIWSWSMLGHFDIAEVTFPLCFRNFGNAPSDPNEVDLFHINAIDRLDDGDYLVTARHADAVFRVDRSARDPDGAGPLPSATGYVEWILSSLPWDPADPGFVPNKNEAPRLRIVGDPLGGPLRPHDARLDGNVLTMHDNRTASDPLQPSRFVQYRIAASPAASPSTWTATMIRQIDAPFGLTSGSVGSARLADDGSVLMNWGGLQPMFVEYDADGNEVLRIALSVGRASYRIVKYAPDDFDADELRATAGNTTQPPP